MSIFKQSETVNPTWYFTFGCGQQNAHKCQPIQAPNYEQARLEMFRLYGDKWCFQYSTKEWTKMKNDSNRFWPMEEEMPLVVASSL